MPLGYKIAIFGSGEFRHTDRHCVAPFVAEREQKEPAYQRLQRHKHKWLVLERVKGIEPSYSAWKAAALPLSYTRAQAMNYHAGQAASTAHAPYGPLNRQRIHAYTDVSINNERR
jgi:hypothetical protein